MIPRAFLRMLGECFRQPPRPSHDYDEALANAEAAIDCWEPVPPPRTLDDVTAQLAAQTELLERQNALLEDIRNLIQNQLHVDHAHVRLTSYPKK